MNIDKIGRVTSFDQIKPGSIFISHMGGEEAEYAMKAAYRREDMAISEYYVIIGPNRDGFFPTAHYYSGEFFVVVDITRSCFFRLCLSPDYLMSQRSGDRDQVGYVTLLSRRVLLSASYTDESARKFVEHIDIETGEFAKIPWNTKSYVTRRWELMFRNSRDERELLYEFVAPDPRSPP